MAQRPDLTVQTFLFADLSGFTALTEAHGDEQAVDLVDGFCVAVRQLLAAHHAHEVKTIGDALMLRTGDTAAAIRLGLCIVHDVGARHGFPLVRVGMHTGPAVERGGDWFGATVNLAARVSAAAAGGRRC
jgi:class 3 adenylate cyclase